MPVYKTQKPTKDGRRYYFVVSYTDLNGNYAQYKSKKYLTAAEAKKAEKEFSLANAGKATSNNKTIDELTKEWLIEKKKVTKLTTYEKNAVLAAHFQNQLGSIRIANLTKNQYQQFLNYLEKQNRSVDYKNKVIGCFKQINTLSKKRYGYCSNVPDMFERFRNVNQISKKVDFYTLEEFNTYINKVDDSRYIALFTTLFYCGLRIGEADALTYRDIDFKKKTLEVNKSVSTRHFNNGKYLITSPKNKASNRIIPIPDRAFNAIRELQNKYKTNPGYNDDWYVFGGPRPIATSTITSANDKYSKAAGLRHIRLHDFRHSCASLLINNGANITLVSRYLGHANITQTLNTYSHFYQSKLDELMDTINNL